MDSETEFTTFQGFPLSELETVKEKGLEFKVVHMIRHAQGALQQRDLQGNFFGPFPTFIGRTKQRLPFGLQAPTTRPWLSWVVLTAGLKVRLGTVNLRQGGPQIGATFWQYWMFGETAQGVYRSASTQM